MRVIADVLFAITIVSIALGAIAEVKFRIGNICTSAHSAAVIVIRLLLLLDMELNDFRLYSGFAGNMERFPEPQLQGHREDIQNIFSKENEIIDERD